jgi:tRNA-modifying protein YgfZ
MAIAAPTRARLDRGYVDVSGPDAEDFLERMLSNEVSSLAEGEAKPALLLTPKGRIVAPMRAVRRGAESFLLVTETEALAEPVAQALRAARFAAKCEIEVLPLEGHLRVGSEPDGPAIRNRDFGVEAWETWAEPGSVEVDAESEELEALRIQAGTPAWGKELDDSILPAEAGLDQTHISFTKGCFPGQEPVARLRHRGHANRALRRLDVADARPGDEIHWQGKAVGRVTSAVPGYALGYVRVEVPDEAALDVGGADARLH